MIPVASKGTIAFALVLIMIAACSKVRPLAISDPQTDTDSDTETEIGGSTCEELLTGTIDTNVAFSGTLEPGSNHFEIGTEPDAGPLDDHHSNGSEHVWKLIRTGTPKITVEVITFSVWPSGCMMTLYLHETCESDDNVMCTSEDAFCLGEGLLSSYSYNMGSNLSFSNTGSTPDTDFWLFFDTDAVCTVSYEVAISYEDPSPDGGIDLDAGL